MNCGYVKVATCSNEIKVCDVEYNSLTVKQNIELAYSKGANIIVFPELCLSGATCGDLFFQKPLLNACVDALIDIAEYTKDKNLITFVGLPYEFNGTIYNVCACLSDGKILGIVPKAYINEQSRCFSPASEKTYFVSVKNHQNVPFGKDILFCDKNNSSLKIGVEIGEETGTMLAPSIFHASNGARIIVNPFAIPEYSGCQNVIKGRLCSHSLKTNTIYLSANAGVGESTTDYVFSGYNLIVENGKIICENKPFEKNISVADVDLEYIDFCRSKNFKGQTCALTKEYNQVYFSVDTTNSKIERVYNKNPFTVVGEEEYILNIQAQGLAKRVMHTNAKTLVLGLSGGLDSTLALIVAVKAAKIANKSLKDVLTITMPCFATSARTFDNSVRLAKGFGVSLKKVDITKSVKRHLKDLSHAESVHDAAYENAQARERTQVLMDTANMYNGLVVGTGDLSELALGWATYNGDHMSMYSVNGSIPKTLVRHLVKYYADTVKGKLKATLYDILDTPISPELIPSDDKTIKQVTEDLVGPYILHDFFLYYMLKCGFSPKKIYMCAVNTFKGEFDSQTILKWLKTFYRRFFNQQFKRSCLPDGVMATEISLSPRGSYQMPSDSVATLWQKELENFD